MFRFLGQEIQHLHIIGCQFANGVFRVVRLIEGKHGAEPERKTLVVRQLGLQPLYGVYDGWKLLDGVFLAFHDKYQVNALQVLLYLVFKCIIVNRMPVHVQDIAPPLVYHRHG